MVSTHTMRSFRTAGGPTVSAKHDNRLPRRRKGPASPVGPALASNAIRGGVGEVQHGDLRAGQAAQRRHRVTLIPAGTAALHH